MDSWPPTDIPPPDDEFRISSVETLRLLADPLRLRIIEELYERPLTVKQLAQTLELKPTKLYYHVNLLEEHGLIRVVATRVVSGIIEKLYHVRALNYPTDRSLLATPDASGEGGFPAVIASLLEHTSQDIKRAFKSGLITLTEPPPEHRTFMMLRAYGRHSPEEVHDFIARFEALMEEFNRIGSQEREGDQYRVYGLTIALYPTHHKELPYKGTPKEAQQDQP